MASCSFLLVSTVLLAITGVPTIEGTLESDLLQDYATSRIPRPRPGEPCITEYSFALNQIISVNIVEMSLDLLIWSRMRWRDERLSWDPAEYGGETSVAFEVDKIFVPDVVIYETLWMREVGSRYMRVLVSPDGTCQWFNPRVIRASCSFHIRNYPFDRHQCVLTAGSWGFSARDVDIHPLDNATGADLGNFEPNGLFELESVEVERLETEYATGTYSSLLFRLSIRRMAVYYVVYLLTPTYIICLLGSCVFFLPAESGEKMGFSITILLALTVNLLLVMEKLPETSNTVPVVSAFFVLSIGMSAGVVLLNVLTLNLAHPLHLTPCPGWVRDGVRRVSRLVTFGACGGGRLPSLTVEGKSSKRRHSLNSNHLCNIENAHQPNGDITHITPDVPQDETTDEEKLEEWRKVARVLERILGVLYIIVFVILAATFLLLSMYM